MTTKTMKKTELELSRREREIMNILYQQGLASATAVRDAMTDPPSNSTVRTILSILEEKGHITSRAEGKRYIYKPRTSRSKAAAKALKQVIDTFFDGSVPQAMIGLIETKDADIDEEELASLRKLILKHQTEDQS